MTPPTNRRAVAAGALCLALPLLPQTALAQAVEAPAATTPSVIELDAITLQANGNEVSYTSPTTTIGRIPQDPKEVPQTITAVTAREIADRNYRSNVDLLQASPGVVLNSTEGRADIRGYGSEITIDGVQAGQFVGRTSADLSAFESVEILKGPAATFQGAGGFGGTINYSLKRPLDRREIFAQVGLGHPSAQTALLDYNLDPLLGGRLRARFVGSYENRDLFNDPEKYRRVSLYGVVEYDLTDRTKVHFNVWQQKNRTVQGFRIGLPTYSDGSLIDFPMGTTASQTWNRWEFNYTLLGTGIEHAWNDRWTSSLTYRYGKSFHPAVYGSTFTRCTGDNAAFNYSRTGIDKNNPDGRQCFGTEFYNDLNTTEVVDLTNTGSFDAFGQSHDVVFGITQQRSWFRRVLGESTGPEGQFVVDIFDPDHSVYDSTPDYEIYEPLVDKGEADREINAFAQVTVRATDKLRFPIGGRMTWIRDEGIYTAKGEFTPSLGVVYDVNSNVSVYGQYAKMFQGNGSAYGWRPEWTDGTARNPTDGILLPNVTGVQREVGVKATLFDNVLATASIFEIVENNRPREDPDPTHASTGAFDTFQIATGETRSRGFEASMTGEVLPGWNVSLGYAYLDAKFTKDDVAQGAVKEGAARHSANLWTDYTFQGGRFEGLSVGGGVRLRSKFSGSATDSDDTNRVEAPGYGILSARAVYPVSQTALLSINVDNLADKKYYEIVDSVGSGNYQGEGRRVSVQLSSRF